MKVFWFDYVIQNEKCLNAFPLTFDLLKKTIIVNDVIMGCLKDYIKIKWYVNIDFYIKCFEI